MNFRLTLLWLAVAPLSGLVSSPAMAAERATVTGDSATLYSKMSAESDVVGHLRKGESVSIEVSLMGSDGMWCAVTQLSEGHKSGYVHADLLERESVVEGSGRAAPAGDARAAAAPMPVAAPLPAPRDAQIYLVPIGDLAVVDLQYLASFYEQKYRLHVETLAPVALEDSAFNILRQQYEAQGLMVLLKRAHPELVKDHRAILIGITESDMYTSDENWRFALGWRERERFAVVSCARMDLNPPAEFVLRGETDSALLHSRLRKMISREIGFLYYQLPFRSDPRSLVRTSILGVDDLDVMGEDF